MKKRKQRDIKFKIQAANIVDIKQIFEKVISMINVFLWRTFLVLRKSQMEIFIYRINQSVLLLKNHNKIILIITCCKDLGLVCISVYEPVALNIV